ncbi:MAG: Gfo/Idh/MocA family oxidoreductase [Chloroflexi bacterium]|nr:Gfo/Idh/MocA family oxidoreductase [Chloroflexota bacterium]
MIRIGILGTGVVSRAHIASLRHLPQAKLVAFVDPVVERAEAVAAELGGRAFANAGDALDLVDAVWICTPPHLHAELAIAAARAGKHAFVEKPMAHTVEAADAMIAAAHRDGVKLMVGQSVRFMPAVQTLHQLVTDGTLGDLVACWSRRLGALDADRLQRYPWWRRDWRQGGGFTIEWGIHEIDFVRWIGETAGGRVERVNGEVRFTRPADPHFDDYVRATLHFSNGVVGGFEGGLSAPLGGPTSRVALGTRGMAVFESGGLRVRLAGERQDLPVEVAREVDPATGVQASKLAEDEDFLRAIEEDRPPAVTGEDGRASLALCHAIHRASREGETVRL